MRGVESKNFDGFSALTGISGSGSTTADSYIVLKYLKSRALLQQLEKELNLKAMFSKPNIDWVMRMNENEPIEDFVEHWSNFINTQFDPNSGIIEFTVQAFSPIDSKNIAERVIFYTQKLINELSLNARNDTMRFAKREVDLQEARLRKSLESIRIFRSTERSVDPTAAAVLDIKLLSSLESQLIDINARISALSVTLKKNAPSLISLKRQAAAVTAQIEKRRARVSGKHKNSQSESTVTQQLSDFETLDVERRFAEQSYASALASLEQARRDADRQQRYLAIHMTPQEAEVSEYPERLKNILLAAFILFAIWAIGVLIVYSVRDHLT
ncbi:MAG: hypothetical protein KGV46_03655 [Pasteurella sp.]|nr:hypothetical protein [Pasteurella sp.]